MQSLMPRVLLKTEMPVFKLKEIFFTALSIAI